MGILFDLKLALLAIVDGCHNHKPRAKLWACNNSASITRKGCKDREGLKIAKPALIHNGLGFLAQQFQAREMTYLVSIKHQKRVHEADHDDT